MEKPDKAQFETARRLLAHEAQGVESVEERAAAVERVLEKVFARLSSLVGRAGARALFARSVKVTAIEILGLSTIDLAAQQAESPAAQIVSALRRETPTAVMETAMVLCATLLALLSTLIGARLTMQVLKKAWPGFDVSTPKEETR
jgi:hypothetical protein